MDSTLLEALIILHNMALENDKKGILGVKRWHIDDEPLRNDAARLLRKCGYQSLMPVGTHYVGDEE